MPDSLYFVADGAIRLTNTAADGKQALLAIVEPPQWFGELSVFDRLPHFHEAWIESDDARLAPSCAAR